MVQMTSRTMFYVAAILLLESSARVMPHVAEEHYRRVQIHPGQYINAAVDYYGRLDDWRGKSRCAASCRVFQSGADIRCWSFLKRNEGNKDECHIYAYNVSLSTFTQRVTPYDDVATMGEMYVAGSAYTSDGSNAPLTLWTPNGNQSVSYKDIGLYLSDNTTQLRLDVRACCCAHVRLSTEPFVNVPGNMYEVIFGGWQNAKSCVGHNRGLPYDVIELTPSITDCVTMRPFWISWRDNLFEMGEGTVVGSDVILGWTELFPFPIRHVAIATSRNGPGDWVFY